MQKDHSSTRNAAIDLIRGTSILYIVGYWHLFNYTHAFPGYANIVTSRLTIIALGLFVLISGYLVEGKTTVPSRHDIFIFYKKKLLRIYPPFIIAAILFYLLGISEGTALAKSAALLSMFSPPAPPTLWFITMLALYYIIAPLLMTMRSRFSIGTYILFVVLILTAGDATLANSIDIRLAIYFPVFATGVLLARHEALLYRLNIAVIALLLIVSVVISCNQIAPVEQNILSMPLALFGPLLIFVFAMRRNNKIRRHWSIALLSYASLFMYLFHRPLYEIFRHIYAPASGAYQIVYLFVICLPLIVAISWLGQKAYNQFIIQLTRRLSGRGGADVAT